MGAWCWLSDVGPFLGRVFRRQQWTTAPPPQDLTSVVSVALGTVHLGSTWVTSRRS